MKYGRLGLLFLVTGLVVLPSFAVPAHALAPTGVLVQRTWGGGSADLAYAVAVDSSRNVYMTGYTQTFGSGNPSISLLKYDRWGGLVWERVWSGGGIGYGVALDSGGGVYVTGFTVNFTTGSQNVLLLKFNSTGGLVWQRTWAGGGIDGGQGLAVDSSDNIYVTGYTSSFGAGSENVLLLRFNSSGSLVWQKTWGNSSRPNSGQGVAVDTSGDIYVTGTSNNDGAGSGNVVLLKFNSTGGLIWQRTWGGYNDNVGRAVALDSSGDIYVTGYTASFGAGLYDVFLLKFDSFGSLQWQRTWGTTGYDFGQGVALDNSGGIFVTGCTISLSSSTNAFLLKFDSAGTLSWQIRWGRNGALIRDMASLWILLEMQ